MSKKKLKINIFTYILLNIMILVLINDYFTYFFNLKYILSLLISLCILIIINLLLKEKFDIYHKIEKTDIIFYILLLGIIIITIPYADRSFDTYNYHLYLQENPFGSKLGFDLFAGKNFNSFTYAFSDRLFYLFRFVLGFRLGTVLNYFLLVVLYYQVKYVFSKILNKNINRYIIAIFSTMCVLSLSIVEIVDSYYIDIISIVLLFESFNIALFGDKLISKKNNIVNFGYLGLLFGLSFAVKISNAIPIILIFIIYFINHKNLFKCLTIKNVLITLLMFLFPFLIYFIYTFVQTGNPVFPFYNTIFHSKYFANANWLDTRFGPSNIIETIFWPLIILFQPNRFVDSSIVEPMWCYGYVISIFYIIYYVICKMKKKLYKIDKTRLRFFISTIIFYLVWSKFLLGYSRYGLIVLVCGSISCCICIYDLYINKKVLLLACLIPLLLYNFSYSANNFMFKNQEWLYNNVFNSNGNYKYNLKNIFYRNNKDIIKLKKSSAWAVVYNNSGLLQELNSKVPMINLSEFSNLYSKDKSLFYNKHTIKLIQQKLKKYSTIYTAVDSVDYDNFLHDLNNFGFEIINVEKVITFKQLPSYGNYVYVFEIKNKNNLTNNSEITFAENKILKSEKCENNEISMFIGSSKDLNHNFLKNYKISVYGVNNQEKVKLSECIIKYNGSMKKYQINVDSSKFSDIDISIENLDGVKDSNLWVTMLNYSSICK